MAEEQSFYDLLFNQQKIVAIRQYDEGASLDKGDCRLGIVSKAPQNVAEEKLLQGMMSACGLSANEWWLFPENTNFQTLRRLPQLRYLLLLGISERQLNLSIILPFYKPVQLNQVVFIQAHALSILNENADYKKALWVQALKPVFEK